MNSIIAKVAVRLHHALPRLIPLVFWSLSASADMLPDLRSVDELVRDAIRAHPDVQAVRAALTAADATLVASGAMPEPVLSWALAPNTLNAGELGQRHVFAVSQRLPWFGKRDLARQKAGHLREIQAHELAALQLELAARIRSATVDWQYLREAQRANQASQRLVRDLTGTLRSRYAAGRGSQQVLLHAEMRELALRKDALALDRQLGQLLAALRALVSANLPAEPPAMSLALAKLPSQPEILALAVAEYPALAAENARYAARSIQIDQARKDYVPDVQFTASYLGALDPAEKRLQLGLAFELPINLAQRRAQLDQARAQAARQHWRREALLRQIEASIQQAWSAAFEAEQRWQLFSEEILPLAQQVLASAQAEWAAGNGSFKALIEAEQSRLDAVLGQARALSDALSSRIQLARLSGVGVRGASAGGKSS